MEKLIIEYEQDFLRASTQSYIQILKSRTVREEKLRQGCQQIIAQVPDVKKSESVILIITRAWILGHVDLVMYRNVFRWDKILRNTKESKNRKNTNTSSSRGLWENSSSGKDVSIFSWKYLISVSKRY
jgi:hypothetical protein